MKKKSSKRESVESIAEAAGRGEDISRHFTRKFQAKQRVNVDFPLALLRKIDEACNAIGVTRQAWIKMACNDRLHETLTNRVKIKAS